jgi:hypothetical protein
MKKRVLGMLEEAQQPDPAQEEAKKAALRGENAKAAQAESAAQKNIADAAGKWADVAERPDRAANDMRRMDMDERQSQQAF